MSRSVPARSHLVALAAVSLGLVMTGCGGDPEVDHAGTHNPGGVIVSGDDGPYAGAEPAKPYTMPDVTLTATNGADVQPAPGHWLACHAVLLRLHQLHRRLPAGDE